MQKGMIKKKQQERQNSKSFLSTSNYEKLLPPQERSFNVGGGPPRVAEAPLGGNPVRHTATERRRGITVKKEA